MNAHTHLFRIASFSLIILFLGTVASIASYSNGSFENLFNTTYSTIFSPFGVKDSSVAPSAQAATLVEPAVTTDKSRYLAGESVVITGSGYVPGQTVSMRIIHNDDGAESGGGHDTFYATADQSGTFQASWPVGLDTAGHFYKLLVDGAVAEKFGRVANANADKNDYQPGETAVIALEGFNPNEAVTIQITHVNGRNDGAGHDPFTLNADQNGRVNATWYVDPDDSLGQIFRLKAVGAVSGIETYTSFTDALVQINDDAGPDDEPGQKDLSFLRVDNVIVNGLQAIGWGWDDVQWSGQNSGDACALYDSDGDGNANFALCVTISQTITSPPPTFQRYTCTDNRTDRCTGPTAVANNGSVGSASIVNDADPFRLNAAHTSQDCKGTDCVNDDAVAAVSVLISDVGGAGTRLTNICSFPSQEPNSDPSDCVVNPNNGLLTIVKVAPAGDTTQFTFNASAPSQTNLSSWNIVGNGTVSSISYAPGATLDLSEVVPSGYSLSGASCVLQTQPTAATGTPTPSGVENITIQSSVETICTFTNVLSNGTLELRKELAPTTDSGLFNLFVKNSSNATVASAANIGHGGTTGAGGTSLNVGTYNLSETAGTSTNLNFYSSSLACVNRSDSSAVTVSSGNVSLLSGADVVCTFTNRLKRLEIDKEGTLDLGTNGYADPGDLITYTFTVTNTGAATLTGITVSDPLITGAITCTGQTNGSITLTPGQSISCSATYAITAADIAAGGVTNTAIACDDSTTCTEICPPGAPTCDSDLDIEPIPGKLIVQKVVVNDNGGTKIANEFSFQRDGGTATPFIQNGVNTLAGENIIGFPVGTNQPYTITEPAVSGYSPSLSADCTGTISNGQTKTCIITNDDQAGTLIVNKVLTQDNGGTEAVTSFSFKIDGGASIPFEADASNSQTVNAGIYNVVENAATGYTTTYSNCANVEVSLGETETCTITNNDNAAHLIINKVVVTDNGGTATAADFSGTFTGVTSAAGQTWAGASTDRTLTSVGAYNVLEPATAGYTASFSADCTGTIALGETKTCTVTNNDQPGTLIVNKVLTQDNGGTEAVTTFSYKVNGGASVPFEADASNSSTVAAGTYTVVENAAAGYTTTYNNCSGVEVSVGETETCTITNNDQQAYIAVNKIVNNGSTGGNAQPNDFNLTLEGNAVSHGVAVPVNPGTYTAGETLLSGYTFDGFSGQCDSNGDVTVALGESKSCTLTNSAEQAYITVVKAVTNDHGGNAGPNSFGLTLDGMAATSGIQIAVTPGTHTAAEAVVAGYAFEGFTGACNSQGQITVALGESKTCTLTNNDIAPQLTVIKHVVNDSGGTKVASDFMLDSGGTDDTPDNFAGSEGGTLVTLDAGPYNVTETGPSGYSATFSANCSGSIAIGESKTCTVTNDDQPGTLIVNKVLTQDNGGTELVTSFSYTVNGGASVPFEADASNSSTVNAGTYTVVENAAQGYTTTYNNCANVEVSPGETETCTITNNDQAAHLIINKVVTNDNGGGLTAADFSGTFTGVTSAAGQTWAGASTDRTLTSVGAYNVLEPATAGYTASFSAECTGTIALGETKTCTVTNDDQQAFITVVKVVNKNNGGTAQPNDFALTLNGTSVSSGVAVPVSPGTYTAGETLLAGYAFDGFTGQCTPSGAITVALGESKTCTLTNHDLPGTLIVRKRLFTPIVTDTFDDFQFSVNGLASVNFEADGENAIQTTAGTTYNVVEDAFAGYVTSYDNCSNLSIPLGGQQICTITNIYTTGFVTSSSLCTFDVDPDKEGSQFRLLYTPDNSNSVYKLNASNPGQYYYNVLHYNDGNTGGSSLTMNIPYPFVTHGATPVHVYDSVSMTNSGGQTCLTPIGEVANQRDEITLATYELPEFGQQTPITVNNLPIGLSYVNIHLDYGLKRTTGYVKNTDNDAIQTVTDGPDIPDCQEYIFTNGGVHKVESVNNFKKNPGVGGLLLNTFENPLPPGQTFKLRKSNGQQVGINGVTDVDGWFFISYKHTGPQAVYTVEWVNNGSKTVTLKSNAMAQVNFP
jgi:uncharacterized repeat protein (TIGR01451 family)